MKQTLLIFAVLSLIAGAGGCAMGKKMTPVVPPVGAIYTSYKAPLQYQCHGDDMGSKTGTSKTQRVLIPFFWLSFAWGDAALREATQEGNITTLKYADYEFLNVLGIYQEFTVRAYGD